jgi:hypothetical protein
MAAGQDGYVPFLWLASAWAAGANVPEKMVLRRLCDWAMADGFPPGALTTKFGGAVDLFDVFMCGRYEGATSGGILLGGIEHWSQRWDGALLEDIIVSLQAVATFCDRTDTSPPLAVQRGCFARFVERRKDRKHRFPPPCPEAESQAVICDAGRSAEASLNALRGMLAKLQGEPQPFLRPANPSQSTEPVDLDACTARWETTRRRAQEAIAQSRKGGLQPALDALDAEWAAFVGTELARSASEAAGLPDSSTDTAETTETEHAHRLRIMRSQALVFLDGEQKAISRLPLKLLCFLAEKAQHSQDFIPNREIEDHLWGAAPRDPSDVIREVRNALGGTSRNRADLRDLVKTAPGTGVRLALAAVDIEITD